MDYDKVYDFIMTIGASSVIAGGCQGADTLAVCAAQACGIPFREFPADWKRFGKAAGPIRNQRMLDEGKPDLVVAFHEDLKNSKGTQDMINRASENGIPVKLID